MDYPTNGKPLPSNTLVSEPKVNYLRKGFCLFPRSILDSEIFNMPPNYFIVLFWLTQKAAYDSYEKWGKKLRRGQYVTSLEETRNMLKYKSGYRFMKPTKRQTWSIYGWLRRKSLIKTTKVTGGMIVTICNYDDYQTISNYGGNTSVATEVTTEVKEGEQQEGRKYKEGTKKDKDIENFSKIHSLQKYILTLNNVSKIKSQLTYKQCEALITDFDKSVINTVLLALENYAGAEKKYNSVNLTLRAWIKRHLRDNKQNEVVGGSEYYSRKLTLAKG